MAGIVYTNVPIIQKEKLPPLRYGISYDVNDSSPALTRLHDAVGMVSNVGTSLTDEPQNDFDKVWPFSGIVEEIVNTRVMIKIPKFYIRRELTGDIMEIVICKKKYDESYIPHEMFLKGNKQWTGDNPESDYNDYTYISKYEISNNNESLSGKAVQVNQARSTFRTNAKAIGDGWSILDIATWDGLQKLFIIVFSTRYSRNIMLGNQSGSVKNTGLTTGAKAKCVQIGTNTAMSFYGIENLYGNVYKSIDGINFNSTICYICTDISKYTDNTTTNYIQVNYYRSSDTNSYIKQLGFDMNNKFAQLPTVLGGSATTYFTNRYFNPSSGWSTLFVGNNSGNDVERGLFYTSSAQSLAGDVGSRLIYRPI